MRLVADLDQSVPTRDGTRLAADVYRLSASLPLPILIERTPLIRTGFRGDPDGCDQAAAVASAWRRKYARSCSAGGR